jgi:hypothetical protein
MLNNDNYETYIMTKMKMEHLQDTADRLRMASAMKEREKRKHGKAVTFILHSTGKALISTGNRLLKIA